MAKPIEFKPATVNFRADLQRRLEKASDEHAEALLAAYDVLEAAYDEGLLDILHGMIASKDKIITTLSRFASQPEGVAGIRNLLTAAKILTELDPEVLDNASRALASAREEHAREQKPPRAETAPPPPNVVTFSASESQWAFRYSQAISRAGDSPRRAEKMRT